MQKILFSLLGALNAVALMAVTFSANSACCWIFHQPEFPEEANVFKKVAND